MKRLILIYYRFLCRLGYHVWWPYYYNDAVGADQFCQSCLVCFKMQKLTKEEYKIAHKKEYGKD